MSKIDLLESVFELLDIENICIITQLFAESGFEPLTFQCSTTPTTVMIIKSRRDQLHSAYLHIVMDIAQLEQNLSPWI
jgi:hypothetical protein